LSNWYKLSNKSWSRPSGGLRESIIVLDKSGEYSYYIYLPGIYLSAYSGTTSTLRQAKVLVNDFFEGMGEKESSKWGSILEAFKEDDRSV
jgi:hypothetical protein